MWFFFHKVLKRCVRKKRFFTKGKIPARLRVRRRRPKKQRLIFTSSESVADERRERVSMWDADTWGLKYSMIPWAADPLG